MNKYTYTIFNIIAAIIIALFLYVIPADAQDRSTVRDGDTTTAQRTPVATPTARNEYDRRAENYRPNNQYDRRDYRYAPRATPQPRTQPQQRGGRR